MSQSFFHLTPANDPEMQETLGSLSYCADHDCAAYTDEEHEAVIEQAKVLGDALYDALHAHSKTHPEMSYDVILHALDCMAYCIRREMAEDSTDA